MASVQLAALFLCLIWLTTTTSLRECRQQFSLPLSFFVLKIAFRLLSGDHGFRPRSVICIDFGATLFRFTVFYRLTHDHLFDCEDLVWIWQAFGFGTLTSTRDSRSGSPLARHIVGAGFGPFQRTSTTLTFFALSTPASAAAGLSLFRSTAARLPPSWICFPHLIRAKSSFPLLAMTFY